MAKTKQSKELVLHNFVAKHMHEFQRSHVFEDRKKADKRGKMKHKKERYSLEDRSFFMALVCA
ncbi:DUF7230 family protein [Acinetobacter sp. MD2(2019)]|uniref:DUF7230 family protein n=1 Tax=Acinetobacter sp. MD2(2019) TaxID=2605273 RepID=UPI002D1F0B27|nr:hypothetical protein [Acinetobacter sp. MD2(2019)]MEB3753085.1 hypothetical protein [Acinetobacter sp. MD2(2019)]